MNNSNLENNGRSPNLNSFDEKNITKKYSEYATSSVQNFEKIEDKLVNDNFNDLKNEIKTLVLDLDETLVHSSFDYIENPDIIIPIIIEEVTYEIYVLVRPGTKEFIHELSKFYEIVIFTASISEYADPLISLLDPSHLCKFRLFRDHCTYIDGTYVKDLNKMGRHLRNIVIVDNSPISYSFHKNNGVPIKSWYEDKSDRDLIKIIPYLQNLSAFYDVRTEIPKYVINNTIIWKKAFEWFDEYNLLNSNNIEIQSKIIKSTNCENYFGKRDKKIINNQKLIEEEQSTYLKAKHFPDPNANITQKYYKDNNVSRIKTDTQNKENKECQLKILNILTQQPQDESSSILKYNIKTKENSIISNNQTNNTAIKDESKIKSNINIEQNYFDEKQINETQEVKYSESDVNIETNISEKHNNSNGKINKKINKTNTNNQLDNKENYICKKNNQDNFSEDSGKDFKNIIYQSKNFVINQSIPQQNNKKNNNKINYHNFNNKKQDENNLIYRNTDFYSDSKKSLNKQDKNQAENNKIIIRNQNQNQNDNAFNNQTVNYNYQYYQTDSNSFINQNYTNQALTKTQNNKLNKNKVSLTEQNLLSFNHETPNFNANLNNFITNLTDSNDYDDTNIMFPSSVLHTDPIENDEELMEKEASKRNPLDLLSDDENIQLISNTASAPKTNVNAKNININIINGDYNKIILNDNSKANENINSNLPKSNVINNNYFNNPATEPAYRSNLSNKHVKTESNIICENTEYRGPNKNQCNYPKRIIPSKISSLSDSSDISAKLVNKAANEIENELFSNFLNKNKEEYNNKSININELQNKKIEISKNNKINNHLKIGNTQMIYDLSDYDIIGDNKNNNNISGLKANNKNHEISDNSKSFNHNKKLFINFDSNKLNSKSKYFVEKKIEDLKSIMKKEFNKSAANNNGITNQNTNNSSKFYYDKSNLQNTQIEKTFNLKTTNNFIYNEGENSLKKNLNSNNMNRKNSQNSLFINKYLKTDESVSNKKKINIDNLIKTHQARQSNEKENLKNSFAKSQTGIKNISNKSKANNVKNTNANSNSVNINKIINGLKNKKEKNEYVTEKSNSIKKISIENYNQKSNFIQFNNFKKSNKFDNKNLSNDSKLLHNKNSSVNTYNESSKAEIKKSFKKNSTKLNFSGFSPSRNIFNNESKLKHEKSEELISTGNSKITINNILHKKQLNVSNEISQMSKKKSNLNLKILNSVSNTNYIANNKEIITSYNSKNGFKNLNNKNSFVDKNRNSKTNSLYANNNLVINSSLNESKIKEKIKTNNLNQSISAIPQIIKIEALDNNSIKIPNINSLSREKKRFNGEKNFNNFELTFKNPNEDLDSIGNNSICKDKSNKIAKNIRMTKLHIDIENAQQENNYCNLKIKQTENLNDSSPIMHIIEEKNDLNDKNSMTNFYIKTSKLPACNQKINNVNNKSTEKSYNHVSENLSCNLNNSKIFNNLSVKNKSNTNSNGNLIIDAYDNIKIKDSSLFDEKYNDNGHDRNELNNQKFDKNHVNNYKIMNYTKKDNNLNNPSVIKKENNDNNNTFNMFSHYYNLIHKNTSNKLHQPLNFSNNLKVEASKQKNRSELQNQKIKDTIIDTNNNKSLLKENKSNNVNEKFNNEINKSHLENENYSTSNKISRLQTENNNSNLYENKNSINLSNYKFNDFKINREMNKIPSNDFNPNNSNKFKYNKGLACSINEEYLDINKPKINMITNDNRGEIDYNTQDKSDQIINASINDSKKIFCNNNFKKEINLNINSILNIDTKINKSNKSTNEISISENQKIQNAYNTPVNYNNQYISFNDKNLSIQNQIKHKNLTKSFSNSNFAYNEPKTASAIKSQITQNILGNKLILNNLQHFNLNNYNQINQIPNDNNINTNQNNNRHNLINNNKNNVKKVDQNKNIPEKSVYSNNFRCLEENIDNNSNINSMNNIISEKIKNNKININKLANSIMVKKDDNDYFNEKEYLQSAKPNKYLIKKYDNKNYNEKRLEKFSLAIEEKNIYLNTQPNNDNFKIRSDSNKSKNQTQSFTNKIKTKNVLKNSQINTNKK